MIVSWLFTSINCKSVIVHTKRPWLQIFEAQISLTNRPFTLLHNTFKIYSFFPVVGKPLFERPKGVIDTKEESNGKAAPAVKVPSPHQVKQTD